MGGIIFYKRRISTDIFAAGRTAHSKAQIVEYLVAAFDIISSHRRKSAQFFIGFVTAVNVKLVHKMQHINLGLGIQPQPRNRKINQPFPGLITTAGRFVISGLVLFAAVNPLTGLFPVVKQSFFQR